VVGVLVKSSVTRDDGGEKRGIQRKRKTRGQGYKETSWYILRERTKTSLPFQI
jgi:hypothetical protein